MEVKDFVKTLIPITDFNTLEKGEEIFNRCSNSIHYIDVFDHMENWNGKEIIFYKNYKDELWHGTTEDYWYYYR